jgi:anti-sigma factor ChrR (cupin superfamily)
MTTVFPALLRGEFASVDFTPFRAGIEIAHLYRSPQPDGPAMALLRYAAGASVPLHEHVGVETICVLSGSQSDEGGTYLAGALVVNPPGSRHRVWSEEGCVVLISWAAPVRIIGED